ncbi:uncharacterized protein VTP21DRAFT_8165 [Calcarisporiella thermophila]|uniref:uncharacterized protein n=1 Tax=Calcarisporiella thermophila TaxID=911321 RepID=UPI0037434B30
MKIYSVIVEERLKHMENIHPASIKLWKIDIVSDSQSIRKAIKNFSYNNIQQQWISPTDELHEYFPEEFFPGEKRVHILIELPRSEMIRKLGVQGTLISVLDRKMDDILFGIFMISMLIICVIASYLEKK